MLSFVDTMPRYRIRIIDKYVTVTDRNYVRFRLGDTRIIDTLGDNRRQLDRITDLMRRIVEQQKFFVDTVTLAAAASPEGVYAFNDRISKGRAEALKQYLVRRFGRRIAPLLAPGSDGINGVNLANAIQLSSWLGKEVDNPVDPELYAAELNKRIEAEGKFPTRD